MIAYRDDCGSNEPRILRVKTNIEKITSEILKIVDHEGCLSVYFEYSPSVELIKKIKEIWGNEGEYCIEFYSFEQITVR